MAVTKIWAIKDSLQRVLDYSERTNSVSGVLHTGNHDRIAAWGTVRPAMAGITGACELTVRRSRSCASGQIVESDTKNHRERIVTIPLELLELLMALRQQQVLHSGVPDREKPIFTDPDGHVPHPDTFTRHLRKLYKQCGLSEDYHLHTLRHFYATICCRKVPANRWQHPCWVMRIGVSWNAPTATRRTWRNSRPQS